MKRTPQECPNGVRLTLFINQYFREYQNYNFYTAFTLLIQRLLPLICMDYIKSAKKKLFISLPSVTIQALPLSLPISVSPVLRIQYLPAWSLRVFFQQI